MSIILVFIVSVSPFLLTPKEHLIVFFSVMNCNKNTAGQERLLAVLQCTQ